MTRPKTKKHILQSSGFDIPDHQYESLARTLLPMMQKYYESADGKRDLEQYRAEKAKQAKTDK